MKFTFSCERCGGSRFIAPLRFTGTSVIKCGDCGHAAGTVAEIQKKVIDELVESSAERDN